MDSEFNQKSKAISGSIQNISNNTMASESMVLNPTTNPLSQEKQKTNRDLVNDNINISNNSVSVNIMRRKTEPTDMADEFTSINKPKDVQENILNNLSCNNEFVDKNEFGNLSEKSSSSLCNDIETVYIKQEKMDEDMFSEEEQSELLNAYSVDVTKIKYETQPVDMPSSSSTNTVLKQSINMNAHTAGHLNVRDELTEIIDGATDDVYLDNSSIRKIKSEPVDSSECEDELQNTPVSNTVRGTSFSNPDQSPDVPVAKKFKQPTTTKCDICSKTFERTAALIQHKRIHSERKSFQCNQCNKVFTKSSNLIRHKRLHSDERPYKCDQCDKAFSQSSNLIVHKRIHSEERPFKCDECNKSFACLSDRIRHKRVHSAEKSFKCDQCDKAFSTSSNLIKHKRVHSGEKPFKCDQCDKAFSQSAYLIVHKRLHSEERPFKCDRCNKTFACSSNHIRHKRVHSGEKSYKCDQCDKTFSVSSYLVKHKRIHSGEKPFKCDWCDKAFAVSSNLIKHKRIHSRSKF